MHAILYVCWLVGQILDAAWLVIRDTLTGSKRVCPVVVHYPLRLRKDSHITALASSITITPGTMSIGLREDATLLVHAVYGSNPREVLESIADMEQRLVPSVAEIPHDLDAAEKLTQHPAPKPQDEE